MAHELKQMPSRYCGCCDCVIDLPEHRYGYRPPQAPCVGKWRVRYRADGRERSQQFATRQQARQFSAFLEGRHGA